MKKTKIAIIILGIILCWSTMGITDFILVQNYHKPIFCICTETMQDGGSGKYVGLGYSFDIEGNFTPDTSDYGITSYRGYIFNKEIIHGFWERMLVGNNYYFSKMNFNVSFANWTDDKDFYTNSINSKKYLENDDMYLPIYFFETFEELNSFKQTYDNVLSMNQGWDEVSSFTEVTEWISEDYFVDNSLALIYISANNCTHRFTVTGVQTEENKILFEIEETTHAEVVDTAMAGWFITAEIPNDLLTQEIEFDALIK